MNKKNITQQILMIHEEETMRNLMNEVKEELKDGVIEELQGELNLLLKMSGKDEVSSSNNILSFNIKQHTPKLTTLAETVLLAAGGKSLGDWFSQPINFGGAGFILDVRKVIGSDNEVDIYLSPNQPDTSDMQKTLASYIDKSIHIVISNNGKQLLEANLYIDKTGSAAGGNGMLMNMGDSHDINGALSIDLVIKD
jgi:hypothetical protein